MPKLEIKNLKKSFGGAEILHAVSFTVESGQVAAVIGSSGSGKTTLLRCMNGLETPDSGEILLDGVPCRGGEKFGLVFQSFHLFPQYTALQNVTLAPELRKLGTRAEIEARGRELLHQGKKRTCLVAGPASNTREAKAYGALEDRSARLYPLFARELEPWIPDKSRKPKIFTEPLDFGEKP